MLHFQIPKSFLVTHWLQWNKSPQNFHLKQQQMFYYLFWFWGLARLSWMVLAWGVSRSLEPDASQCWNHLKVACVAPGRGRLLLCLLVYNTGSQSSHKGTVFMTECQIVVEGGTRWKRSYSAMLLTSLLSEHSYVNFFFLCFLERDSQKANFWNKEYRFKTVYIKLFSRKFVPICIPASNV